LLALALLPFWISLVTGQAQDTDSLENIRAAINLERTGTISDREAPPFGPSMQREPLPSLWLAQRRYVLSTAYWEKQPIRRLTLRETD